MNPNVARALSSLGKAGSGMLGVGLFGAYAVSESLFNVEGGKRAILFSRIGGVQPAEMSEGTLKAKKRAQQRNVHITLPHNIA